MRAFVIKEYAHPSKISVTQDFPEPKAGPGEVLVDVYSAGLNYFDILQSQGKYQVQPPRPFVLGSEFAGKIAANSPIPQGCPFRPGDRVFGGLAQGAYAERMAAPWQNLIPLPDNMSYDQGAGLFITWPTSYEALVGRAELKAGEWVLVTASAGGVGIAAVQLAKALGAKVIAAAGSPEKVDISIRYGGADHGVNYSKEGWQKEVLKITGGKGVDVIYDPVGLIRDSLKCIAWKGRALVVGFAAGTIEKLPLNLVLLKNISIVGIHWGAYTKFEPSRTPVVWKELLDLFSSGRAKPVVYPETFPLERLGDGLVALESRKTWGKVIAHVREPEGAQAKAKL
ncbi:alcohol dehydrogenase [Trametes cingulata]|nr:alcohol dehydrogenase [Trametes cingulata]